jgi:hypothetical protein
MGFRYEFHTNPKDTAGQLAFYTPWNFAPGIRSKVFPSAPPGILFVGDDGMPDAGGYNHWGTVGVLGPRFGFAYDLSGNGKTVVRAAFGITNVPVDLQMVSNSTQTPPFVMISSLSYPASFTNPFQGRIDPFPAWQPKAPYDMSPLYPTAFYPNMLDYRNGYSEQWNFTIEREVKADMKVSVSYVGMHGLAFWDMQTFNAARYIPGTNTSGSPLSTAQNADSRRPWAPYYGSGNLLFSTDATRKSNSLQLVVQKRYSRGLTIMGHYTLSNTMSWCDDGDACTTQDTYNHFADYSRANVDIRHRAVASWVYDFPKFTANRVTGLLTNGWQITGAMVLQGGMPINLVTGLDNSRTGVGTDRPNLVGDWQLPGGRSKGEKLDQYFNTTAFTQNNIGEFGNLGRNALRGPGLFNIDLGIFKSFDVREKQHVELRGESFNVQNRANFGNPSTTLSSSTFGKILSAGSARIVQIGLKYIF